MSDTERSKEEVAISILTHNVELLRQDIAEMKRRQWTPFQKAVVGSGVMFIAIMVAFDKYNSGAWDVVGTAAVVFLLLGTMMAYSLSVRW